MSATAPKPAPRRARRKLRWIGAAIALVLAGTGLGLQLLRSDPEVGDCLTSMDDRFVLGLEVVECADADAGYEVVEKRSGDDGPAVCTGHADGKRFAETGRRGKVFWQLCAVPR